MSELTKFDQFIVDNVMEAIIVLRCLKPDNIYKVECLACQLWNNTKETSHSAIGRRIKWLSKHDYLPLKAITEASDGSMTYQIN